MAGSSTMSNTQLTSATSTVRYWKRSDKPIRWWPWGLIPLIGLFLLYLWGAFITAPGIEDQVTETVGQHLEDQGFPGAAVTAAGQEVDVNLGFPEDEFEHAQAVARSTRCDTWIGRLICPTDVNVNAPEQVAAIPEPLPVSTARPHDFVLAVDSNRARITGEVPSAAAKSRLLEQANAQFDQVDDQLRVTSDTANEQWPLAATRAVQVAATFERGVAVWENTSFSARGLVSADNEALARRQFAASTDAPNLGALNLEVAKTVDTCNEEFAAALSNSTINFATNSATIDISSQTLLEALAQTAKQCPGALLVEGHTDSVGAEAPNLKLSQERADAVQAALNALGVTETRISAVGYGESQPIASNESAEGRAQNRRIVVQIAAQN